MILLKFKKFLKLLGIWILLLAGLFLVLEAGFRLFRREPDPLAQIVQKRPDVLSEPGSSWVSVSSVPGEFSYTTHINRYGYRGKDFVMPKPAGLVRVFAVGDSFTFGVGSEDDQTWPALLETALKARGSSVEVINAGIGCTSPMTYLMNLKKIHLRYQPDVVVLFFDMTDLWDDWYSERHAIKDSHGAVTGFDPMIMDGKRDWWITATYYSSFCRYFHNKVVRSYRKMRTLGAGEYWKAVAAGKRAKAVIASTDDARVRKAAIEYDGLLMMRGRGHEGMIREHWARTTKYLLEIRDLLKAQRIPFVVVMYPHGIYVDGDQWRDGRKTWGFETGKRMDDHLPFELMQALSEREHISFINTLGAFLSAPREKFFFDWDGHMTPAGNRIVASAVAAAPQFLQALSQADRKP